MNKDFDYYIAQARDAENRSIGRISSFLVQYTSRRAYNNKEGMESMRMKEGMYGLFHVNVKTGEKARFSGDEVLEKNAAEQRALDCRIGQGRGSAYFNGWRTEAHLLEQQGV